MTRAQKLRYPLLMTALTLLVIWKIHLGLFHDEVQVINLGKLLVEGDSFVHFTGMGMSHYLLWPLMAAFHRIVGSYEGVFLYLRYWYVLIQLLISIYTYTTIKLFWSEKQATAASCLAMLFVFNFYSITYKTALFWCTMLTVLFLLRWEKTRKIRYLIFSALALSADVLGFPPSPALLLIPVTRLLLRDRSSARRTIAVFWGTCAVAALAFLLPIFLRYQLSDLMNVYFGKSVYQTTFFGPAAVKMGKIAAIWLAMEAAVRIGEKSGLLASHGGRLWDALSVLFWCALVGIVALKLRSVQASRFWYFFLGVYVLAVVLRRHGLLCIRHGQLVDILFYEVSAWTLLGIALISDQGVAIVAYGSVFGLIGACMSLLDEDNGRFGRSRVLAGSILLAMLICSTVFVSDESSALGSSNIFQHREKMTDSPGKGLYVTAYTMQRYDQLAQAARRCTDSSDRLFIVSDMLFPFGPMSADVVEAIPCGYQMGSYAYASKGVDYCARFPERSPTVVLVDSEYVGDVEAWTEKAVFGKWMKEHFEPDPLTSDERWHVFRLLPEV